MSIAERARELAEKIGFTGCDLSKPDVCPSCESDIREIEQALLAERRLAMEEAAKMAELLVLEAEIESDNLLPLNVHNQCAKSIAKHIRAVK